MRQRETFFEQVPIKVVEVVIQQTMEPPIILGKSPAAVSAPKRKSAAEARKRKRHVPCRGSQ